MILRHQAQELLEVIAGAAMQPDMQDVQRCYAVAEQIATALELPEGESFTPDWTAEDFVRIGMALRAWGLMQTLALRTEGGRH
jgi:hypothetical protein